MGLVYAEITPQTLIGNADYNESFFKQLDLLENKILDGQSFEISIKENNLKVIEINKVNKNKQVKDSKKIEDISNILFNKIYAIKNEKTPEIIRVNNKYFLAEIKLIEKNTKSIENFEVVKDLNAQINFQNKIEKNTSILKDISMGSFDKEKMETFANQNNLKIVDYELSDLKQNEIFTEGMIKRIFSNINGKVDLITDSTLSKSFLILVLDTKYKKIAKSSNEFERYQAKARLDLINNIYKTFDDQLNQKYKVELNQRTIDRVKNSF